MKVVVVAWPLVMLLRRLSYAEAGKPTASGLKPSRLELVRVLLQIYPTPQVFTFLFPVRKCPNLAGMLLWWTMMHFRMQRPISRLNHASARDCLRRGRVSFRYVTSRMFGMA